MTWRGRVLDILTIATDAAWIYVPVAIVSALFGLANSALGLPMAVGIGVVAFTATRWLASLTIPLNVARGLSAAFAAISVYVVVGIETSNGILGFRPTWPVEMFHAPPDARHIVIASMATLAFWTSGIRLGLTHTAHESLSGIFRTGVAAIITGVILSIFVEGELGLYPTMYLFFAASLTGFALARVSAAGGPGTTGTWVRLLAISLLIVLGGSLALALLTRTLFGDALSFLADMAWLAVQAVAFVIGLGVSYIAEWIILIITPLIPDNVQEYFRRVEENLNRPPPFRPDPNQPSRLPGWLPFLAQWGSVTVVLALVGGFIFLLFRGRFRQQDRVDREERRALQWETSLRSDLTSLLGNIIGRKGQASYRGPRPDTPVRLTYRLYYSMLRLAGRLGVERKDAETPFEFERRAVQVLPAPEAALLTQAFSRARYGDIAPSEEDLAEMRAAWTRLTAASAAATGGKAPAEERQEDEKKGNEKPGGG